MRARSDSSEPAAVARGFLDAFSAADVEGMRAMLAEDVIAYITNAEGGVDRVQGRDAYLSRVEAMDLQSARFSLNQLRSPPAPQQRWTDHRMADGRRKAG